MKAPRIETPHLLLRAIEAEDFDRLYQLHSHPDVMAFIADGKPMSKEEAFRYQAFLIGHWSMCQIGSWIVEEKSSQQIIGRTGFLYRKEWDNLETVSLYFPEYWGKGYAHEAGQAALQWGFSHSEVDEFTSAVQTKNHRSIAYINKTGRKQKMLFTSPEGYELAIYAITRQEFLHQTTN